jgi:branched-chain amino acid transport system permease protein
MKNKFSKKYLINFGIVIVAFLLCFILISSGSATRHFQSLLVPIGINIILAVSLNLAVGFLGQLTLGHAGFMSVGAYGGCLFSIYFQE